MRRYEMVSGAFFAVVALGQLCRAVLSLPVTIDGRSIPVWLSYVAFAITATLAVWAVRFANRAG